MFGFEQPQRYEKAMTLAIESIGWVQTRTRQRPIREDATARSGGKPRHLMIDAAGWQTGETIRPFHTTGGISEGSLKGRAAKYKAGDAGSNPAPSTNLTSIFMKRLLKIWLRLKLLEGRYSTSLALEHVKQEEEWILKGRIWEIPLRYRCVKSVSITHYTRLWEFLCSR